MKEHTHTGPVDRLSWCFSRVAMWTPAAIVTIIFYEVVMRYVFASPTLWVNEMSLWLGGFVYVSAGLYAMQQRSHIRIFVIYDMVPLLVRRFFDLLSAFCIFAFAFAVIWGGYGEAIAKFWRWEKFGTAFNPPIPATNKMVILLTLALLAMQALSNLVRDWPMHPRIRQGFDICATLAVTVFTVRVLPHLFDLSETGPQVPMGWRIGLGLTLCAAAFIMIYGLFKDFNRTPEPYQEIEDPTDEVDLDLLRPDTKSPDKD